VDTFDSKNRHFCFSDPSHSFFPMINLEERGKDPQTQAKIFCLRRCGGILLSSFGKSPCENGSCELTGYFSHEKKLDVPSLASFRGKLSLLFRDQSKYYKFHIQKNGIIFMWCHFN
jgi:hypothetical protein